tara:strand:- start:1611 stop:2105 length:495 start_codon:yes stop_codon:yes gene_type:complete
MSNKLEKLLWNVRYITLLAVVLSIISAFALLLLGSWNIVEAIIFYNPLFDDSISNNNDLLFKIISAIDLFLIGIVLLIFGFGIYELFVSEIDFANAKFTESTLKIRDLDQLKNKIIKVIIIVLIVKFFEKVLKFSENFTTPSDILYFGLAILSICLGYFLINRK